VKQTRKVHGGASRSEVEKTWKRNIPGEVSPGQWTPSTGDAVGNANPMEGVAQNHGAGNGASWSYSVGAWNFTRGFPVDLGLPELPRSGRPQGRASVREPTAKRTRSTDATLRIAVKILWRRL